MHDTHELIAVRKQHLLKPGTGIVQILFTQDATGRVRKPSDTEFPTGTIWISGGYDEIEEKFMEGELFIIDQYRETDKDSEAYDSAKPDSRSEHWAKGNAAKKLESSRFIPVIDSELPDIGTGVLHYYNHLPQGQFLILNEEHLYGPFSASRTEDEIQVTPYPCMPLNLGSGEIAKLPIGDLLTSGVFLSIEQDLQINVAGVVTSIKDIAQSGSQRLEKIDYINDSQLINYFAKNGFGTGGKSILGRKPAEQLKAAISQQAKRRIAASDNGRLDRLSTILDQYLSKPDPGHDIIDNWLDSSAGKTFLKEMVIESPEIFESHTTDLNTHKKQLEDDLEKLRSEKRRLESEVHAEKDRVLVARNDAEKEVDQIRKQTAKQQQEERQKVMADLEDRIQSDQSRLEDVQGELDRALKHLHNARTLEALTKEIEYNERKVQELKAAVTTQERLLKSPDLSEEAIKTQTLLDLIHGRRLNQKNTPVTYTPPLHASSLPEDGKSIVQAMADHFEDGGRSFTFEEMANLLITIQQSFLTVLKGLPGAGKTSTAIRLAQAYHIANEDGRGDDFLNVPISRGWVSGRDFIGFYNSLKGSYQPARTGMYQFLSNGGKKEASDSLRLVLLDEANLSPIEHYLSDFLGMFDIEGRNRPIDTGSPDDEHRLLAVPLNTRFIATINNDNTTEPLSPRLCDRVPIISMDLRESESKQIHAPFQLDGIVPYAVLEGFFGVRSAEQDTYDDLPLKLASAIPLFEERNRDYGQVTTVSKRKRLAMQVYYAVARRFMDETRAADFAMSQYALPLINGFGQPYKNRLERIAEHAQRNNLSRSSELLEEIITNGDAHVGSYSFF
jgi:hypothetical protein